MFNTNILNLNSNNVMITSDEIAIVDLEKTLK